MAAMISRIGAAQHPVVTTAALADPDNHTADVLWARSVSVHVNRVPLGQAIDAVAASARVPVAYQSEIVSRYTGLVTVHLSQVSLRVALEHVLAGTGFRAVADGATQLAIVRTSADTRQFKPTGSIIGTVMDAATKHPLRGVTLLLDDATRGGQTDEAGHYRLTDVGAGPHRVTVRLLGYGKRVVPITVVDNEAVTVDIALDIRANTLDQVVVTGAVIPTELKAIPNAITVITAREIERRGITHIDQLFRGDVPGLFAVNSGTDTPLDEVVMFSRGASVLPSPATTFAATTPIKTYVDGVELADPKYLSQIDPKSIERIEILTGPQASTIYGSNAINGVMQIFTKRGTTNRPQVTLSLASGWVENNFSPSLTPQHDYSASVSGIEGRLSYNLGTGWTFIGAWTPAKRTSRLDTFGGGHMRLGSLTSDITFRQGGARNRSRGDINQPVTAGIGTGQYAPQGFAIHRPTEIRTLSTQTVGLTLDYAPSTWWSNSVVFGKDVAGTEQAQPAPGMYNGADTLRSWSQTQTSRSSLQYTATTRFSMQQAVTTTITIGADAWNNIVMSTRASRLNALTGALNSSSISLTRQPTHNAGAFMQGQLGVYDALFLTYGVRAEWNPSYGSQAQPNIAPRVGAAYTYDLGAFTAKIRASYGHATRPPATNQKLAMRAADDPTLGSFFVQGWGNYVSQLANRNLGPEHQQGGEGGLELYLGTHASLVITRYNQTVSGLISSVPYVDSVRSLAPDPYGLCSILPDYCGYAYVSVSQNLNVGDIRNQGWELQGTLTLGPWTARGNYSWTKSRVLGITPAYRAQINQYWGSSYAQYQNGAPINYLPEHTWLLSGSYGHAGTTLTVALNGTGSLYRLYDDLTFATSYTRLIAQKPRAFAPLGYRAIGPGYTMARLDVTHRFSNAVEGIAQVDNLTNFYRNDYNATAATIGRQSKIGCSIRF